MCIRGWRQKMMKQFDEIFYKKNFTKDLNLLQPLRDFFAFISNTERNNEIGKKNFEKVIGWGEKNVCRKFSSCVDCMGFLGLSLLIHPYHPSFLANLLDCIQRPHRICSKQQVAFLRGSHLAFSLYVSLASIRCIYTVVLIQPQLGRNPVLFFWQDKTSIRSITRL